MRELANIEPGAELVDVRRALRLPERLDASSGSQSAPLM